MNSTSLGEELQELVKAHACPRAFSLRAKPNTDRDTRQAGCRRPGLPWGRAVVAPVTGALRGSQGLSGAPTRHRWGEGSMQSPESILPPPGSGDVGWPGGKWNSTCPWRRLVKRRGGPRRRSGLGI